MQCICCGNNGITTYPIPSHIGNLRACATCIGKFGIDNLAIEADRLLTDYFVGQTPQPKCAVCGSPVLLINASGAHPVWCQRCELQRQELVRNAR